MSSMPHDPGSNNSRCHLQVMAMQAMDGRAAAQLLLLCEHVWQEGATKLPRATYRLLHERPEAGSASHITGEVPSMGSEYAYFVHAYPVRSVHAFIKFAA